MASRQLFRRLSPILRSATRALPATRSAVDIPRHAVVCQGLTTRLTPVRCMCKTAAPEIVHIQDEDDFRDKVLQSKKPIIVDFHANWCGPCKLLDPRLETVVAGENGRVVLAKVDIDENIDIAMQFGIQSVPTVLAFKDGRVCDEFIGLRDDDEIKGFVKRLV